MNIARYFTIRIAEQLHDGCVYFFRKGTCLMTGRTILHYGISEELSRGGMGVVYNAANRLDKCGQTWTFGAPILHPKLIAVPFK